MHSAILEQPKQRLESWQSALPGHCSLESQFFHTVGCFSNSHSWISSWKLLFDVSASYPPHGGDVKK